ncbi:hypothetical protein DFP83_1423 [Idiomarina fontislapidosi]|uniref:Uncharacterized protein n=1 Tax=Idiomarina fontislapidosi TaxID=263723 RepID=A0A432XCC9_9GAMM|nr:hypothetical protein [Idiomarina fontislapidosi]PYE29917.1 hypothetical protein DFP83_1423 [Idiomarina fontislapidosi]RUO46296.1 hypothetical protein CWE25_13535 [Idiomarina fontislapidosi]
MKKLIVLLTSTLLSTGAISQDEGSDNDICANLHSLAEVIMERRQEGTSVVKMMEVAEKSGNGKFTEIIKAIVEDAYNSPKYSTQAMKQDTISTFANNVYMECRKW